MQLLWLICWLVCGAPMNAYWLAALVVTLILSPPTGSQ